MVRKNFRREKTKPKKPLGKGGGRSRPPQRKVLSRFRKKNFLFLSFLLQFTTLLELLLLFTYQ